MFRLSQLFTYPVKSMRGLHLSHAQITESGLAFDRIFMLTTPEGIFITARQYPQLLRFTPALISNGLVIQAPDNHYKTILFSQFSQKAYPTEVWGNQFTSFIAPDETNQWLKNYLHLDVQLRWLGEHSNRRIKNFPDKSLSFADGYPYLLINQASLELLQSRCHSHITVNQFRPNLVTQGFPAFAEDSWKTLRIGEVIFDAVKPCSRCILTTIHPQTGKKHPDGEPLSILQQFRIDANKPDKVNFGINLIARNRGILRLDDQVEILETQSPPIYLNKTPIESVNLQTLPYAEVNLTYQGKTIKGNNQQVILEQLEQQGIQINYSCRAGICGCCKVKLIRGQVRELKKGAIKRDNSLLACSCIPVCDIELA